MILKILPSKKKLFRKPKYSANVTILENKNIKCIKDKEGNLFTPSEIYRKYREEEKEQENNEVYNSTES